MGVLSVLTTLAAASRNIPRPIGVAWPMSDLWAPRCAAQFSRPRTNCRSTRCPAADRAPLPRGRSGVNPLRGTQS